MEIHIKPEQENFILRSVQRGRFASPDAAVQEAIALLERTTGSEVSVTPERKNLALLFAESPFKGLDLEFERGSDPIRAVEL